MEIQEVAGTGDGISGGESICSGGCDGGGCGSGGGSRWREMERISISKDKTEKD